ncbi:MAG: hypothetical protein HYZ75_01175 [Elusimicrobia bacterium]|nr:hypothetical protein [Elusimicrobiota bacterium]
MRTTMLAVFALLAAAAAPRAETLGAGELVVEGKVTMLNPDSRHVKIRDAAGFGTLVRIPLDLDFTRLRLGERVTLRCVKPLALAIGPAPKPRAAARMAPSDKPAPRQGLEVMAKIVGIDRYQRTLKVRAPDGAVMDLIVSPAAPGFDVAKVGDAALLRYVETEALGLDEGWRLKL